MGFDIGAYDGTYSVWLSKLVKSTGLVYSFEPHPYHKLTLESKIKKLHISNIIVSDIAFSDHTQKSLFYFSNKDQNSQASTICEDQVEWRFGKDFDFREVQCSTIDEFCQTENVTPDLIKIDVEGAEKSVIMGGSRTIDQNKPIIIFESGLAGDSGFLKLREILSFLYNQSYNVWIIDIFKFTTVPASWENVLGSENRDLKTKLFLFEKEKLDSYGNVIFNFLAIHSSQNSLISRKDTMYIDDALTLLTPLLPGRLLKLRQILSNFGSCFNGD
jgi:FkbM family methyltransferase